LSPIELVRSWGSESYQLVRESQFKLTPRVERGDWVTISGRGKRFLSRPVTPKRNWRWRWEQPSGAVVPVSWWGQSTAASPAGRSQRRRSADSPRGDTGSEVGRLHRVDALKVLRIPRWNQVSMAPALGEQ